MTIEPRPARAIAPPITWQGTTTPSTLTWTTRSSDVERHVLERADLLGGRVGRRVDRRGVDEQVRDAPVDLDQRERRLDLRRGR